MVKYRLRKLTVGLCSVALMSIFTAQQVHADSTDSSSSEATTTQTSNSEENKSEDTNSSAEDVAEKADADAKQTVETTASTEDAKTTSVDATVTAKKAIKTPTINLAEEEAATDEVTLHMSNFDTGKRGDGRTESVNNVSNTSGYGQTIASTYNGQLSDLQGKKVTLDADVKNITPNLLRDLASNASELTIQNPVTLVNRYGDKQNISSLLSGNTTLTKADFSGLELTTNVVSGTLAGASNLESIVLPKFTSDTTDLTNMLANNPKLASVTFTNTPSFKTIDGLFRNDSSITNLDFLNNVDLSNVTSAKNAFEGTGLTGAIKVPTFKAAADVTSLFQNVKGITSVDATSLSNGSTNSFLRGASGVQSVTIGEDFVDGKEALNTGNRDMVVIVPDDYDVSSLESYTKALSSNFQILGIRNEDGSLSYDYTTIQPKQVFTQDDYANLTVASITNDIDSNDKLSDDAKQALKDQLSKTDATNKVALDRLDQVAKYSKHDIKNLQINTIQYDGVDVLDFVANTVIDDQTTLTIKKSTYVPGTGYVTYGEDQVVNVTVPNGLVWDAESGSYKYSDTYDEDFNKAASEVVSGPSENYTFDEDSVTKPDVKTSVKTNATVLDENSFETPTLVEYSTTDPTDLTKYDTALTDLNGMSAEHISEKLDELNQNSNVNFVVVDNADGTKTVNYIMTLDGNTTITSDPITITPATPFTVKGDQVLTEDEAAKLTADQLVDEKGDFSDFSFNFDPKATGEQTVTVTGKNTKNTNDADTSLTVKVKVLKNFTAADKTVAQGSELKASDLVTANGDYTNFVVEGYDATKPGVQTVTIKGDDGQGHSYTTQVKVTVVAKDFTVVDSYTTKEGEALEVAKLVTATGDYKDFTVAGYDANKVGEQTVTVTGTDNSGNKVSKTVKVTVTSTAKKEFTVVDSYKTKKGEALDAAKLVTDAGDYKDFTVEGYNANKPGEQTVTVTGVDADGNKLSKTVKVTVEAEEVTPEPEKKETKTTPAKKPLPTRAEYKAAAKKLPQTGDNSAIAVLAGSISAFIGMLGLGYKKRK
ncbi:MAG: LPXTG cell wall anchor domain-containing protein [Lactobacillus sp.]|nr:LPXTG cell wall anchor domain-containing protein [Lactobacillus sp.]